MFSMWRSSSPFLMMPGELNWLIQVYLDKQYNVRKEKNTDSYTKLNNGDRQFVVFDMMKDSENPDNEVSLSFVIEKIRSYIKSNPESKERLLMPLGLCRGYFKVPTSIPLFQRHHAVLVEVDLLKKEIIIHDSQGAIPRFFYPDKFVEHPLPDEQFSYEYRCYGTQGDNFSCMYFVLEYIVSILNNGSSDDCKNIGSDKSYNSTGLGLSERFKNKNEFIRLFDENPKGCLWQQLGGKKLSDDFLLLNLDEGPKKTTRSLSMSEFEIIRGSPRQTHTESCKKEGIKPR